ncbi:sodium-dependent glucose transporter 1B-like isoform X2 [Ornithodoros turicata]|uniref:sodium-dependent glucose transporter 1B-like isoform X2 n=1 Tax=Ornithodoros turicata TaxID=34597 RepID=UPI003139004B
MVDKNTLLRVVKTINVDLACSGIGLITTTTAVGLLDLADIYGADVKNVAQLVTTRGVGGLLGSFIGGFLYNRYNTQLVTIGMMLLQAVSVVLLPICGRLALAHVAAAVSGIAIGAFDTGANIWLINLWPANCGPSLQIYHFMFGVGAFVAPLMTYPFLSPNSTTNESLDANIQVSPLLGSAEIVQDVSPSASLTYATEPSRIHYAFAIVSAVHVFIAILMVVSYIADRSDCKPVPLDNAESNPGSGKFAAILLSVLSVFIFTVIGLECCYSQMLATFAVSSALHFSKSSASYLTSVFFLTFSLGRVMCAFCAAVSSPFKMLLCSQVLLLAAHGVLVFLGESSAITVWSMTAVTGLAQAALYGTAVAWCVRYVVLGFFMMSALTVAASAGSMAAPVLVGLFIDDIPMVVMYVCFGATVLMGLLLVIMFLLTRNKSVLAPVEAKSSE